MKTSEGENEAWQNKLELGERCLQKDFAGEFLNEAMDALDLEGYKLSTYQADMD